MKEQLYLDKISVDFGGLKALNQVSFSVDKGQIVGLIGPNGAGKTTIFNVITGVYKTSGGDVTFSGNSLLKKRPYQILTLGIARTFQTIRLFKEMTTLENTMIALHSRTKRGVVSAILRTGNQKREEKEIRDRAFAALKFMGLESYAAEISKNLPYGLQRRLEIARALASDPKVILLDEPAAGMNPAETLELIEDIRKISDSGVDVLLVEHDMKLVMEICKKIVCIDYGIKIAEGTPEEIRRNPKVIKAYLGEED